MILGNGVGTWEHKKIKL